MNALLRWRLLELGVQAAVVMGVGEGMIVVVLCEIVCACSRAWLAMLAGGCN